ncbi:MAG: DUF4129 domain-containing protein [Planctomycetaceae bacterium]|nr:DUF4129 domain-containing protein [Planctomycetaceae bacterium]
MSFPFHVVGAVVLRAAESDDSVEAGRDALSHWGRYPWYDSKNDGLQPVDIVEPWDWSWLNFGPVNFSFDWLYWLFWGLIVLLLGLLVWFLIRAFLKRNKETEDLLSPQGQSPEEERRRIEALPEPVRQRTRLLEAAQRHYQEGNFNEAIVYLFSHQLVYLDKNFLIRLTRGKTNRQYLRELGRRDTIKRILADTIVAFEDVFFGGRSIGQERFERCWNRLGEFEALAAGGASR